jgi:uncharacterized membrane protein (DUF106 family)
MEIMINIELTQKEHYLLMKALRNEMDNTNDSLRSYNDQNDREYLEKLQALFSKLFE